MAPEPGDSRDGERSFLSDCFSAQRPPPPERADGQVEEKSAQQGAAALRDLARAVIGSDATFVGPYGERRMVYADWAASGRCLQPVEDYICGSVLPYYANTHTTSCHAGMQSTCYREEARQIIAEACNARVGYSDQHADVVVFAGSGSTGAVNKMVMVLGLHLSLPAEAKEEDHPVVFVGPYEHHSNVLPWRESVALVEEVAEAADGGVDQQHLAELLQRHSHRRLRIGSFSAASNVTGVCSNVDAITEQLHRAGALAFWDYAAAGPYLPIDMNPIVLSPGGELNKHVYKDAVFISTHKFPGGVGGPGLLVAKRKLFRNAVPSSVGGGTVFFVTSHDHRYLSDREDREEGGTQDIVGSIRAAMAFQVKESIGQAAIFSAEELLCRKAFVRLASHPRIRLLGPPLGLPEGSPEAAGPQQRLPIFSFLLLAPSPTDGAPSLFLHYNFVCALLNDLFGVQTRGGCACAGPYSLRLLGIAPATAARVEACLLDKSEVLRPGYTRVSLPYFMAEHVLDFVLSAVIAVADHGWRLLPHYRLDPKTGDWRHKSRARSFPTRQWLSHNPWLQQLRGGKSQAQVQGQQQGKSEEIKATGNAEPKGRTVKEIEILEGQLISGLALFEDCLDGLLEMGSSTFEGGTEAEAMRWFMVPSEAAALLAARKPKRAGATAPKLPLDWIPSAGPLSPSSALQPGSSAAAPPPPAGPVADSSSLAVSSSCGGLPGQQATRGSPVEGPPSAGGTGSRSSGGDKGSDALEEPREGLPEAPICAPPAVAAFEWEDDDDGGGDGPARAASRKYPLRSTSEATPAFCAPDVESMRPLAQADESLATASWAKPPQKLVRLITKAIIEWKMIEPGDRLLLGLSGGKDSLTLLHCLKELQRRCPPSRMWSFAAATVDPGTSAFNPRPLIPYLKALGVEYHFLESGIFKMADSHMQGDSICAFCSRMKRGALYTCCREHGYNKLVLGQHLDDQAESFLMSALHNGRLRTMKANYTNDAGDIAIIRPLVYVREKALRDFAYASGLPVINENCPACYEEPKERQSVKKLLAREEAVFPHIFNSLLNTLVPLMDPQLQDETNAVRDRVFASNPGKGKLKALNGGEARGAVAAETSSG